jgi:hypothetical protein
MLTKNKLTLNPPLIGGGFFLNKIITKFNLMKNNDEWLEKTPIYKTTSFIVAMALLLVLVIVLLLPSNNKPKENNDTSNNYTVQKSTPIPISNWQYSNTVDEMEGRKVHIAECYSDNNILFEFPYNQEGGSSFELFLRKNKDFDIGLSVSKGQFLSGYGNRGVKLKFDNEKPFIVGYNGTSDGSSETIFLHNTSKILNKLKTAKKLKIEVEFYDCGNQIINFTVQGLKWDIK